MRTSTELEPAATAWRTANAVNGDTRSATACACLAHERDLLASRQAIPLSQQRAIGTSRRLVEMGEHKSDVRFGDPL